MYTIIVLPDGETWSVLRGCTVMVISQKQMTKLCNDEISACNLKPVIEIPIDFVHEQED